MKLFLLLTCILSNGIYFSYSFIIPYHMSYLKNFHLYSIAYIYTSIIALDLGLVWAGINFKKILECFGIKNIFKIYSALIFTAFTFFIYLPNILFTLIGYFICGFCHQLISINVNHCLKIMYKKEVNKYVKYVFLGTYGSTIFWGMLSFWIVNPDNQLINMMQKFGNKDFERYFSKDVVNNLCKLFAFYAFFNIFWPILTSFFVYFPEDTNLREKLLIGEKKRKTFKQKFETSFYENRFVGGIKKSFYSLFFGRFLTLYL